MEEFCKYNLLKQVKPNLMIPPPYARKFEGRRSEILEEQHLRLTVSDPSKILILCESLNDMSSRALEVKINKYFMENAQSELCFMISLLQSSVSNVAMARVVGPNILDFDIHIDISSSLISEIITSRNGTTFNIKKLPEELLEVVKKVLPQSQGELYVLPVFHPCTKSKVNLTDEEEKQTIAILVCLINCAMDKNMASHLIKETFRFCLPILLNTTSSEEEARLKLQCQTMLDVAKKLFSRLTDLHELLTEIMAQARSLTKSERCSLFLWDAEKKHLVAQVFDGIASKEGAGKVKIPKDQGIAGYVASTGKILNIADAYNHPLFYKGMDEATGFKTRNILCFPIRDDTSVIGVAQLCNKQAGSYDTVDEEVLQAFSVFCGLSIMQTLMFKKIKEAQNRHHLANELLIYHMRVSQAEIEYLRECPLPIVFPNYKEVIFNTRQIPVHQTTRFLLQMYEDCGFLETFSIQRNLLASFILYAQRGYRDTPYHNWMHAFSVAHFCYSIIINFDLIKRKILSDLEAMALITACVCHDIDHRGTNNSFQMKTSNALHNLYSSEGSVMERHHLNFTVSLLNTESCNFLECLDDKNYKRFLELIKVNILATDLQTHLDLAPKQEAMAKIGINHMAYPEHKELFSSLLMTTSDLNDQTKGWGAARDVAVLVYNEFFSQGDMEKEMGKEPIEMMDRTKAHIPDLQIEFLMTICLPVYRILATIFPDTEICVQSILWNIKCWENSKHMFRERTASTSSFQILAGLDFPDTEGVEDGDISEIIEAEMPPEATKKDVSFLLINDENDGQMKLPEKSKSGLEKSKSGISNKSNV